MSTEPIPICSGIRPVPPHAIFHAAADAVLLNPANAPLVVPALLAYLPAPPPPLQIALLTSKLWPSSGVHLTVGFLESTPADLRDRILSHMNAWSAYANVAFAWTANATAADVRITRDQRAYWSNLGTDIRSVPRTEPTMCLGQFTMRTPESEYRRVVRHETGHTLACVHEHARREIVALLDPAGCYAYFGAPPNRWSRQMVDEQILTPLEEASIRGTPHASQVSIMTYEFDAPCVKSRTPIPGGSDITPEDGAFVGSFYPKSRTKPPEPPAPPTPPPAGDLPPLTLGGPPVALQVPVGGRARYALTLTAPTTFTLLGGAIGGTPTVTAGRRGGPVTTPIPLTGGAAAVRAAAGDWEFAVATSAPAGGLVYLRAVPFGTAALRDVAPVEFC